MAKTFTFHLEIPIPGAEAIILDRSTDADRIGDAFATIAAALSQAHLLDPYDIDRVAFNGEVRFVGERVDPAPAAPTDPVPTDPAPPPP